MPSKRRKVKVLMYLYEDQYRKLKRLGKNLDEPVSKLVRRLVDKFLKERT
jgi:hypothetical protein